MADIIKSSGNKGVLTNKAMDEELKRLGIKIEDLLKIKSSGMGEHWRVKLDKLRERKKLLIAKKNSQSKSSGMIPY